ncbi:MAG: MarR family winged helix-turn-helix transcriptional regulator [Propionibacteriaceae bacterium]
MSRDLRTIAGLAAGLRPAILRLSRILRQISDESLQLTNNQLSALGALQARGDQLMGELAAYEHVRPPSMTRTVNSLEELGLLTRAPGAEDRRQATVRLTERGREVLSADRRRRDAWLATRLKQLEPEEREALRAAIPVLLKLAAVRVRDA